MRTAQKDLIARHQEILSQLREQGELRSENFAAAHGISMMTVRRDLQLLEDKGLLRRTHGGAVAVESASGDKPFTYSEDVMACRNAISRFAASFVEEGDRLFINGSRTALNILKYVRNKNISVYTNNGWAIGEIYDPGVSVRIVGGDLHDKIMVGEFTMRNLLNMRAEKTFIGCYAVYDDGVFSYSIPTEIGINEAMIGRTTDHLYILADHSKIRSHEEKDDSYGSCTYDRKITLITDSRANPESLNHLRSRGIEVLVVPADDSAEGAV
ncbi:MAG: DeoR/GlpR family DNA-binding transcription regulator [Solobacterium sp.]|nr:DeoR/GlpR family DNA-binding transcription regulator [Solobacterium sp.]